MSELFADLRPALRALIRRPRFTLGVVLTLALGIGATTAIFSVINAVLIKSLPYKDPATLSLIWSRWSNFEKTWLSDKEYFGYLEQQRLFQDVALWDTGDDVSLTGEQGPENVVAVSATANMLPILGVAPTIGQAFTREESQPNGPAVVLLGYDLWQRRYGGDPQLIGKTIQVNGVANTVVGILPRGFRMPLEFQSRTAVQLLLPLRLDPGSTSNNHSYFGLARLTPGVTEAQANSELKALTARWIAEGRYPPEMQFSAFAVPLAKEVGGGFRTPLLVLLGAVALLLLITCANIANLMLARADSLSREMTVRAALGAGRHRLLRMTLTESLLLAFTGGAIGLVLAFAGVKLLALAAATSIPRAAELGVDARVLGFTLIVSLATGLLFGILPALQLSQSNLISSLREGGRAGESRERRRGRGLLVGAEMALAVMLVIGAVLMVKSFRNLANVDPGFDPSSTLTLRLSLPELRYPGTKELVQFYQGVGDEVRALPGVKAAGFVRLVPLMDDMGDGGMAIEGKPDGVNRSADWQVVGPGYFEAQGLKLIKGRVIDQTDTPDGLQVIMINQELADQYFPGEDPIGQRIRLGDPTRPWRTIIGMVANTRHHGLLGPIKREWFVPHNQLANSWGGTRRSMALVVRTTGEPSLMLEPIRKLIAARDPDLPLSQIATMDEVLSGAVREQRFTTSLMAGFAALALVLAAIGIFAVVSYSVSRRTREIGIRLALGAESGAVQRLVVRQGMAPALLGIATGIVLAGLLSRFLASLLYGVQPRDLSTFVVIPLCLLAVALGATFLPARRATRVDLVAALREE